MEQGIGAKQVTLVKQRCKVVPEVEVVQELVVPETIMDLKNGKIGQELQRLRCLEVLLSTKDYLARGEELGCMQEEWVV